ncbi:MAG: hypothetical protein HY000_41505 [Planctomycetes bacterium]|nr:hypothetical protein [Planctomycetota bacterium]
MVPIATHKPMVRLRLGARHPLSKTVPNLGEVQPRTMGSICHRFEDHWTRVNAALVALAQPAMTLGAFTLALLQAAHATIEAKNTALEAILEGSRPLTRAEMERLYGDVPEDDREEDSIVAIMLGYLVTIQTTFPGQPIAVSVPEIFPAGPQTPLPTFAHNLVAQAGSVLKVWIPVAGMPAGAALVFLKEGIEERTAPADPAVPGGTQVILFNGITLVDDLDELEIRNGDGVTIARGVRNPSLAEPT